MAEEAMPNPATLPEDAWNPFTEYLRDNPGTFVKLRNGFYLRPEFHPAEDQLCVDNFRDGHCCWNINGTSPQYSDYDMMELIK